ncbi:MAG: HNH endonuclease [Pseudomonadota bacterium]
MRILKLDIGGRPVRWVSHETAAVLYCRDQIAWEAGVEHIVLRGGVSRRSGTRSLLRMNSIVATRGVHKSADDADARPALTNAGLFRRDDYICLYCADVLPARLLSRDHVVPLSAGGADEWENVVTACRPCNHRKANYALDTIDMRLLAVPYVPNRAEGLILENRTMLSDQMEFLHTRIGSGSRLRVTDGKGTH